MERKILLISCLVVACLTAGAQEKKRAKIGVTYSLFGQTDVYRSESLDGEASYDGDGFQTYGITYVQPLTKWLEIETGVEYSKHSIIIKPMGIGGMVGAQSNEDFRLLNIPITLRANFLKYFYANGGVLVDLDMSDIPIESQTGLGAIFGLALKYDTKYRFSLFVNPYAKFHSILPFMQQENHQKLFESGFRIGLTYQL